MCNKCVPINVRIKELVKPKNSKRILLDFVFSPLRLLLPDNWVESLGLTSLRAERMGVVLQHMQGRCLDVGCNDNLLVTLYRDRNSNIKESYESVGVDVVRWGGDEIVIKSSAEMPFPDATFDTISFLACLNHIPERQEALAEALRVLKPDGIVLVTMINPVIGGISHRIRFWGEHSQREVHEEETFGLNRNDVIKLLNNAGFTDIRIRKFLYGLNNLYIAKPSQNV